MKKKEVNSYRTKAIIVTAISFFVLIFFLAFRQFFSPLSSISTIVLLFAFYFIDRHFKIDFKIYHYVFIIIIFVSSLFLSSFYFIFTSYDKIQHLVQPILFSSIVFYMVSKLKLSLKLKLTFTFFIVLGVLGLFEVGEYLGDVLFDMKLQGVFLRDATGQKLELVQNRIDDTMIDFLYGMIGSILYIVSTYIVRR